MGLLFGRAEKGDRVDTGGRMGSKTIDCFFSKSSALFGAICNSIFALFAATIPSMIPGKRWNEFSFPSGSSKKAGRNSQFLRLLSKKTKGIYNSFGFLARKRKEIEIPWNYLKKPDTKLHSFGFPEKTWKEFSFPSGSWKKAGRNLQFLRLFPKKTKGI